MPTKKVTAKAVKPKVVVKPAVKTEVKAEVKPKLEQIAKQELDGTNYERCQKCKVQVAARLDRYNWRCPVCGDYEAK